MKKYVESLDVGRVPVSHVESPRIFSLSVPPRHCWALTLAPWPAPNQRLRWWSPAGCRGRSSSARICPRKFVFCTRWRQKLGASGLASFEGHVNFIKFEVSDGSNNFMGHATKNYTDGAQSRVEQKTWIFFAFFAHMHWHQADPQESDIYSLKTSWRWEACLEFTNPYVFF